MGRAGCSIGNEPLSPHAEVGLFLDNMANTHDGRLWWKLRHMKNRQKATSENQRIAETAGGFRFVVRKPM